MVTRTSIASCHGPPRRAVAANARREKVIQTARRLFAEQGFHRTGIAQISQESGVLVGQIYRDFANKEEIVAAIVERDLDEYLNDESLRLAIERRDEPAVRAWIARFLLCENVADPRLGAEVTAEALRNERMAAIFRAVEARFRVQIERALGVLLPPGVDAAKRDLFAELILTLSAGMFQRRLRHVGGPSAEMIDGLIAFVDRELDWLRRGCGDAARCG